MMIGRMGLGRVMWRRSPSPMYTNINGTDKTYVKLDTLCNTGTMSKWLITSYLLHPVSWQGPPIQHAEGAQVEVARIARPNKILSIKNLKKCYILHEVCDAMRVLELCDFTIREAIAVRL